MIPVKEMPQVTILKTRNGFIVIDQNGDSWCLNFWAETQRKALAVLQGEEEHF